MTGVGNGRGFDLMVVMYLHYYGICNTNQRIVREYPGSDRREIDIP